MFFSHSLREEQPGTGFSEFLLLSLASGAGEGNRTLVTCLGSKSSTIELHPRAGADWHIAARQVNMGQVKIGTRH